MNILFLPLFTGQDAIIVIAVVAFAVVGIAVCVGLIILLVTVYKKKLET